MDCINWKGRSPKGLKKIIKSFIKKIRGQQNIETLIQSGMKVGEQFWVGDDCSFDSSFCWLIQIGNKVTFSNRVRLIAHDASIHDFIFKTKIGRIIIDDYVFIGAGSLVLPGVHIGKGAIIAAFSLVNKDIPDGEVWGGVPAHKICNRNELEEKFNSNEYKDIKYDSLSPHEKTLTRESIIEELHNNRFCYLV